MTLVVTPETLKPLVEMLVAARKARGMSQRAVDDRAGFCDGYCEKLEAGVRVPTVEALRIWAAAVDCRLAVIPAAPLPAILAWRGRKLRTPARRAA